MPGFSKVERISARLGRGTRRGSRPDVEGNFKKGREKTGGRQKGTPNVLTREVTEAILDGLSRYGRDGKGTDGLAGYVFRCAEDIRVGATLLRAVLPQQVKERDKKVEELAEVGELVEPSKEEMEAIEAQLRAWGVSLPIFKPLFLGEPVVDGDSVDNPAPESGTTCPEISQPRKSDGGG